MKITTLPGWDIMVQPQQLNQLKNQLNQVNQLIPYTTTPEKAKSLAPLGTIG
jgi:hypothetical protein